MTGSNTTDEWRAQLERDPAAVAAAAAAELHTPDLTRRAAWLTLLGRSRLLLGEVELAERVLRDAVTSAIDEAVRDDEADARLALASVLSFRGEAGSAERQLELVEELGLAGRTFEAVLQRAAIAQREGRLREALERYESVLPDLRAAHRLLDVARVLGNASLIHLFGGRPRHAEPMLREAEAIFASDGNEFAAAQMRHNLGWTLARAGDLPAALAELDAASRVFERLGYDAEEAKWERAEILLAAGLASDALELAQVAAPRLAAAGNVSGAADAWLVAAHSARMVGDRDAAADFAGRSEAQFRELGMALWADSARLAAVRARTDDRPDDSDDAELVGLAERFEAAGDSVSAANAWALAAVAAASGGRIEDAREWSLCCTRLSQRVDVTETRVLAARAVAAVLVASGDGGAASRRIRAALRDVARHRATLGAADARAHVWLHARALAEEGVRLAVASGRATRVLASVDAVRDHSRVALAVRGPQDDATAELLDQYRASVAECRDREAMGQDTEDVRRRQRYLEREVRRRSLRTRAADGRSGWRSSTVTSAAVRGALAGSRLVQLAVVETELVAVSVDRDRCRLHRLGPAEPVLAAARAAETSLRACVAPNRSPAARSARAKGLAASLAMIDAALGPAVLGVDDDVTLVVPSAMGTVPWALLPTLRPRAVSVAPGVRWLVETPRPPGRQRARSAVVAAGPRLDHADREARLVGECYPDSSVITGPAATAEAVLAGLAAADVGHIAAHGEFRTDNPLWSSLALADGPVTVYDIDALERVSPVVVLSSCDSGASGRDSGEQLLGFAAGILGRGTRALVVSTCRLPDTADVAEAMARLHTQVAAGVAPARALAELRAESSFPCGGATDIPAIECLTVFGRVD